MFNSANCLDYGQLDVAHAFLRDEGTESEVGMGVHPATYGTDYYGLHRAALPAITDDIPTDELFGGVEDRLIAEIDAKRREGIIVVAMDEDLSSDDGIDDDDSLSRRDELMLRQHELNMLARGDAYAAKRGETVPHTTAPAIRVDTPTVRAAERSPRHIGVRKERDLNVSQTDVKERKTPRSWKHQEPATPKQFLRLSAANRVR